MLNILRLLKFRPDRLSFEKIYFVRILLEYGDVMWDPRKVIMYI